MVKRLKRNNTEFRIDCLYFLGDKPCGRKRECSRCSEYKMLGKNILILKLGSMGDVLRTTPLLRGLKKKYPLSRITWITKKESLELLENNPLIDILLPYGTEALTCLLVQVFDLVISLDKTPDSTSLAEVANSGQKVGFGLSAQGKPYPFGKSAEYAFKLGISNDSKFTKNRKSYQEIIFEIAGLRYAGEEYVLNLSERQVRTTENFRRKFGLKKNDNIIGFNTGCGEAFQGKKWTVENFLKLGSLLKRKSGIKILLLGGKNEIERNRIIQKKADFPLIMTGCNNALTDFISIVNLCDLVICGDTVAMHITIALKKKVLALFGPTVPQEIDLYKRGKKIFSDVKCSPCYKRACDRGNLCMKNLKAEAVFKKLKGLLPL